MDDKTLIRSFVKDQRETFDKFFASLNEHKTPVDTSELKKLVEEFKTAVYSATNIKPKLDTSTVDQTIKQSVTKAIEQTSISELIRQVKTQSNIVEHNNELLSNGTGKRLNILIVLLAMGLGGLLGAGAMLYNEVPAKIAGVSKYQTLQQWYDDTNETMRNNCKLAETYYANRGWTWDGQCGTDKDGKPIYPLKTSQDLISGK